MGNDAAILWQRLAVAFPTVRKSLTHDKTKGRIVIGLDPPTQAMGIKEIIRLAILSEGGDHKTGDAPRGPKERAISAAFGIGPDGGPQG